VIDRDRILEFIETWRIQLVAACAGVLLVLMIVLVLMAFSGKGQPRMSAKDAAAMKARAIDAKELWIPSEPLGVSGVQLFSEPGAKWSVDEAKKWYTVPGDDAFVKLRSVSRKQIDDLLESVP
jgi:hypothetical protein